MDELDLPAKLLTGRLEINVSNIVTKIGSYFFSEPRVDVPRGLIPQLVESSFLCLSVIMDERTWKRADENEFLLYEQWVGTNGSGCVIEIKLHISCTYCTY